MDTLTSMRVFLAVVDGGTYAAAAKQLHISRAMASKHVMHLEQRLGARLLNRNSRHLSLTESGRIYLERCRTMLEDLDEVEATVSRQTVNPRGVIRLTAPTWLATDYFAGLLAEFRQQYPDVTFDMEITGRFTDIVEEGFDLALRASRSLSPHLIARPLLSMPFHLVASPLYLEQNGEPETPEELSQHGLLAYSLVPHPDIVRLQGPDGEIECQMTPVISSSNESLLHAAALNHMGITLLPRGVLQKDLDMGNLSVLLPDYPAAGSELYAVYTSRRYLSSKVRVFIDFLSEQMRKPDRV